MARMIKKDDIAAVRDRARIDEVVSQYVTLRTAGIGSMKGLCPFHDEKTPSFHVRPQVGHWHCFGCGEGGDVISFVMKITSLPFVEAVESLADRYNVQLHYEDDGARSSGPPAGTRTRLLAANRAADAFFRENLTSPEAAIARTFLADKGFDEDAATHFGIGYAPQGWDNLTTYLRGRGFTEAELSASGLVSPGQRGVYDRFRGRLIWPIRDVTGAVVGFGARRLHDDDQGPKYLNTPETALYKKSQVLYGVDLARKAIASKKQVVVVEGYTDVMAMHLAGIDTAVATCGTTFGEGHIRVVRRLLGDTADAAAGVAFSSQVTRGGEVIFTFDGDEAGQKAALKAFDDDQQFAAQTFVAVDRGGNDPNDLWIQRGATALHELIDERVPLFEFAIKTALSHVDLTTAEGRVAGLRAAAPVVSTIRDVALRGEYSRALAGWVAMDEREVRRAVSAAARGERQGRAVRRQQRSGDDPVAMVERQALEVALQLPKLAADSGFDELPSTTFVVPVHRAVHEAIVAAGGTAAAGSDVTTWLDSVSDGTADVVMSAISALAVAPLPASDEEEVAAYAGGIIVSLIRMVLTRRIADVRAALQRTEEGSDEARAQFELLVALEGQRRSLS